MKKKIVFASLVVVLIIFAAIGFYESTGSSISKKEVDKLKAIEFINSKLDHYKVVQPDAYLMFKLLQRISPIYIGIKSEAYPLEEYRFLVLTNKSAIDKLIPIGERNFEHRYNNSLYSFDEEEYFDGFWYDNPVIVAEHCGYFGYDIWDWDTLLSLKDSEGGYMDTHILLALIFLKENKCYSERKINSEINNLVDVLVEAQEKETTASDLFAERIVFMYWAGYGDLVKEEWIDLIKQSQLSSGGWKSFEDEHYGTQHATGLSLLAIEYFEQGNPKQDILF